MNVENHPLLRTNPELAEQLVARSLADSAFAQRAQKYAELDGQIQAGGAAQLQEEFSRLGEQLISELSAPVASSCCGGCGGGGH